MKHPGMCRGLHEPIISEALFCDVQDYLDGKKKIYRSKVGSLDVLQLRVTYSVLDVAKYLQEVHRKEEMKNITIIIVHHHAGHDSI